MEAAATAAAGASGGLEVVVFPWLAFGHMIPFLELSKRLAERGNAVTFVSNAMGAFLTHCGWGSTIESFAFELPLVMLPFIIDTPIIARAMADRGIGVQVARDESDGSFDRDGVVAAIRRVMVEDEGKAFTTNAQKLKELVVDKGRQEQYIHELEEHLRRYKDV